MTIRLTATGWLVVGLAIAFALTGARLRYPELVGAAAILGLCLGGGVTWVGAANAPLEAARRLEPERVAAGTPATAALTLTNRRTRRRPAGLAYDGPPHDPGVVTAATTGTEPAVLAVPALAPGAHDTLRYELPPLPRGTYHVGPLRLVTSDPLGLARATRSTGAATALRVHPRIHRARRSRSDAGDDPGRAQHLGGLELDRLEHYVPGDDVRHVHWATSLRAGTLMVRHTTVDQACEVLVVLDTDTSSYADHDEFEAAVEVAASVALADHGGGALVRFGTTAGPERWKVATARSKRHLLDRLAAVQAYQHARPSTGAALPWLVPVRHGPGDRSVVVVTGRGATVAAGGTAMPSVAGAAWSGAAPAAGAVTVLAVGGPLRSAPVPSPRRRLVQVVTAPTAEELVRVWAGRAVR